MTMERVSAVLAGGGVIFSHEKIKAALLVGAQRSLAAQRPVELRVEGRQRENKLLQRQGDLLRRDLRRAKRSREQGRIIVRRVPPAAVSGFAVPRTGARFPRGSELRDHVG